ncbi:MAG: ATP-binding protein [Spirochaetia bacterium]
MPEGEPCTDCPRVVFVDDEEAALSVMLRLFRNQAYQCVTFNNGADALSYVRRHPVDVVVSDLRMPGMDGLQFLEQVYDIAPEATRVIVSAHSDRESLLDAINRGRVQRYLVKPWDATELLAVVRQSAEIAVLRRERDRLLGELSDRSEDLAQKVTSRTEQVMALSRHAQLGKYASQIVHNLKSPIQEIGGAVFLANLLVDSETPHGTESQRYLDHVADGARELQRIVAGILLHTVDESFFREEPVNLNEVIERELEFFEIDEVFKYHVERRVALDPELPAISGNMIQLKQVVDNLVKNAVDAMWEVKRKVLTVSTSFDETHVMISVEDTGCGIPEEQRQGIFSPFFTTKKLGQGTGIGLANVKSMVEAYQGSIEVESRLGQGSRFTVYFPM